MTFLHVFGSLADRHPIAVEMIATAFAFVGAGFLLCPFWVRFDRRTGR